MTETASPKAEAPLPVVTEEKEIADPEKDEATPEPEAQKEPETEEGTQDEKEPEEPEPPSFDADSFADNADFKSFREDVESKAHRQGQIREAGRRKETHVLVNQVMQGIGALNKTLTDAAKEGTLADNFQEIINQAAPTLSAYGQLLGDHQVASMREQNRATAIAETIGEIASLTDNKELGGPYYERLIQPSGRNAPDGNPIFLPADEFSIDGGKEVLKDFIKDLVKAVDKKGFERGVRSQSDTSTERTKANKREGKGPGEAGGTASGSGPTKQQLTDMSPEDYEKVDPAERARIFATE